MVVEPSVSLSARRAWIEIAAAKTAQSAAESLSARRAWIEIRICAGRGSRAAVALRKESVDRNAVQVSGDKPQPRRSPQGERG